MANKKTYYKDTAKVLFRSCRYDNLENFINAYSRIFEEASRERHLYIKKEDMKNSMESRCKRVTGNGRTRILEYSLIFKKYDIFHFLISENFTINYGNLKGNTNIFNIACKNGNSEIIKYIFSKTKKLENLFEGCEILIKDFRIDFLEFIIEEIKKTSEFNKFHNFISTVFEIAAKNKNFHALEFLTRYNPYSASAAYHVVPDYECLKIVYYYSDINYQDSLGETALMKSLKHCKNNEEENSIFLLLDFSNNKLRSRFGKCFIDCYFGNNYSHLKKLEFFNKIIKYFDINQLDFRGYSYFSSLLMNGIEKNVSLSIWNSDYFDKDLLDFEGNNHFQSCCKRKTLLPKKLITLMVDYYENENIFKICVEGEAEIQTYKRRRFGFIFTKLLEKHIPNNIFEILNICGYFIQSEHFYKFLKSKNEEFLRTFLTNEHIGHINNFNENLYFYTEYLIKIIFLLKDYFDISLIKPALQKIKKSLKKSERKQKIVDKFEVLYKKL